jgi:hypothetical protein
MHSKLLHEALQKEETRAIVIEVEEDPEEPGEDEEFYAANFELLSHEDEDEEEGMEPYDEVPPLVDLMKSHRRSWTWERTGPAWASNGFRWRSTGI